MSYQGDKQILLPFRLAVPLRSYLDIAIPASILIDHPIFRKAFYSFHIQVKLDASQSWHNKIFEIIPSLDRQSWEGLGLLDISHVSQFAGDRPDDYPGLNRFLIEALRSGYYVETRLNEYFMPCRPIYGKSHFDLHMNMVIGVDMDLNLFSVAGFGTDYSVDPIAFTHLGHAFFQTPHKRFRGEHSQFSWWRRLWLWRRADLNCQSHRRLPDLAFIYQQLSAYLESRPFPMIGDTSLSSIPVEYAWGIATYAGWGEYIATVQARRSPIDLRATRTFWEHKQVMFQRLPVLADAGISLPEENARAIGYISQEARMFWLMSLAYNRERDVGLLAGMMSRLKGIRDLELIQLNLLKSVISDLLSSSL
jgi:hypothetical protein